MTVQDDNERLFQATFEQAAVGIAHVAPDGHWLRINKKLCDILGYSSAELQGKTFQELTHPDDLNTDMDQVGRMLAKEISTYSMEKRYFHKDGSIVEANLTVSLLWKSDGTPDFFISVVEDISDRKRVEDELRRSQERFRDISESSNDWIWEIDATGKYTWVSTGINAILGYEPEDVIGKTPFDMMLPEEAARVGPIFLDIAAAKKPFKRLLNTNLGKDGSTVVLETSGTPILSPRGDLLGYRGTDTDVTLQQRAKDALIEAKEAAESANLAKSRFLATMGHELRTPMNGILGMTQLLLMDGAMEEAERKDYARTIYNSGRTLLTLLNDILDYSKAEAGKMELSPVPFDPQQLVVETSHLFAQPAQAKGLNLEAAWKGRSESRYTADATRLRQMLSNLIGNAIKFTQQGFVRIEATVVEEGDENALLEFAVTDSGIGIAQDKQGKLFQPFIQVDSSTTREYGGTGLGLAIVRDLAHLMGGEIGVESELGIGSRFWFRVHVDTLDNDRDRRQESR